GRRRIERGRALTERVVLPAHGSVPRGKGAARLSTGNARRAGRPARSGGRSPGPVCLLIGALVEGQPVDDGLLAGAQTRGSPSACRRRSATGAARPRPLDPSGPAPTRSSSGCPRSTATSSRASSRSGSDRPRDRDPADPPRLAVLGAAGGYD